MKKIISKFFTLTRYKVFHRKTHANLSIENLEGYDVRIIYNMLDYEDLNLKGYKFLPHLSEHEIYNGLKFDAFIICIFKKKELAHSSWVSKNSTSAIYDSVFSANLVFLEKSGFVGPCNTYGNHKGKGLYPYAIETASEILSEFSLENVLINTKISNTPSIRGINKAGFSPIFIIYSISLFGRRQLFKRHIKEI